jgi:inner membrane protein
MHPWGHVGAALLAYAPVGAAVTAAGAPGLAALGAVVTVTAATVPDVDEFLPLAHRGPTHTVWFVAGCTLLAGGLGAVLRSLAGRPVALPAVLGAAVGLSLASHLLADVVTPICVQLLYPVSPWQRSLELTPSQNPRANAALLGAGVAAIAGSQALLWGL